MTCLTVVQSGYQFSIHSMPSKGVTFQELTDNVRQALAKHYLSSGDYQVKEISNMLGYNELSAFSRAFNDGRANRPWNIRDSKMG